MRFGTGTVAALALFAASVASASPPPPRPPRDHPQPSPPERYDPTDPGTCDPYVRTIREPRSAFGAELSMGGQSSGYPVEGRAWGFGFEARRRFSRWFGVVGRVDRTMGRDAGRDTDGDGHDDLATGAVRRLYLLAGPSITLTAAHYEDIVRWWQIDLLAGQAWTTSQDGEDGVVTGADLSFQLAVARLGVRALQGLGDAREVRALLVHLGIVVGGGPSFQYGAGCGRDHKPDGPAWAVGLDIPLGGYNIGGAPGYLAPGFGVEGAYHLHPHGDFLVRGDVLTFPNGDGDRVLHQTLLAGGRIDLMQATNGAIRKGPFVTLLTGYAFGAFTRLSNAGSGPVLDAGIGLGSQASDGGAWLRLHGRFGLTPAISDLRAVFLSVGLEVRIDRRRWRQDSDD